MLKLAVTQYLKSLGDKIFYPNPDYAEWDNIDCLDAVIEKRPKWFWQKTTYVNDHLGINDILTSPLYKDKKTLLKNPEPLTPNFNYTSKHDIKGKIGAKIASLISLDLSGDDVISVSINFDGLMKQSIDFPAVIKQLKQKKVDVNSKFIQRLAKNRYNVIALVTQYIYLSKETQIKITVNIDCEETNADVPNKEINIKDSGNFEESKIRTITFAAGTRLAFDFAECLIGADGSIELIDRSAKFSLKHMIPDTEDNKKGSNSNVSVNTVNKNSSDVTDYEKRGDNMSELTKNLKKIMNNNNNLEITKNLLILAINHKESLKQLELLLTDCQQDLQTGQDVIDLSSYKVLKMDIENLSTLLKQIGIDNKSTLTTLKLANINSNLIEEILFKILSIYHLEEAYLKNLQEILDKSGDKKEELLSYMENIRNSDYQDNSIFARLVKDSKIKFLLMSVGIVDKNRNFNEYFEPTLNLLYGS